jgi:hypothetical protein
MKYYSIESSQNEKIMGKIPQVKEFIHHCNVWDDPNFIDKFIFEKIQTQPILSNVVLHPKAKRTDIIDTLGDVGFNFSYIISDKLKKIFENFNSYGFQFFKTYVIQENEKLNDYWVINKYDFPHQFIDFKKTVFLLNDRDVNRNLISKPISFRSIEDFNLLVNSVKYPKMILIRDIFFTDDFEFDLFSIRFYEKGGHKGIVSEKLNNEIEKSGITGIEFKPLDLSIYEWLHGEREKVYGKV